MKNWLLPVAVLGVSGIGLLCASERGRAQLRQFFDRLARSEDPLGEFHQAIETQLDSIQRALDHLSEALQAQR
jgi:hypothetical protein